MRSALSTYRERDDFLAKSEDTYWRNVGSLMSPVCFGDLCDCTDTGPAAAYSHAGTRHDAERIGYVLMPSGDAMRRSMRAASLMAKAKAWIEEVGAS